MKRSFQIFLLLLIQFSKIFSQTPSIELGLPLGHTENIIESTYSPDGKFIVTTSLDKTAKIWDSKSGKLLHSLEGFDTRISSISFSPDGERILVKDGNNKLLIWELKSGKLLNSFYKESSELTSASISPDGMNLLTTSWGNTARVWSLEPDNPIVSLSGHVGSIRFGTYSMDGKFIITASDDHTAKVWDTKSGEMIFSLAGHDDYLLYATVSKCNDYFLTTSADNSIKVWDIKSGNLITTLEGHTRSVKKITSTSDGKIISESYDQTVKTWDAKSGNLLSTFKGDSLYAGKFAEIRSVALSPDEKLIAIGSFGITIYDIESSSVIAKISSGFLKGFVNQVVFSPNGAKVAIAAGDDIVKIFDSHSCALVDSLVGHKNSVKSIAYSPDGRLMVSSSVDSTIKIWDSGKSQLLHTIKENSIDFKSVCFGPNGKSIVAICNGYAKVWDSQSFDLIFTSEGHSDAINAVNYSPDWKKVVTASQDMTAKIWDAENGLLIHTLKHDLKVKEAIFSHDNSMIATLSKGNYENVKDTKLRIWDTESGRLLMTFNFQEDIWKAKFSADAKNLMVHNDSGGLYIINMTRKEIAYNIENGKFASFSPNGIFFAVASWEYQNDIFNAFIKVYNTQNGKLINTINGVSEEDRYGGFLIRSINFNLNGNFVVTASEDSTAKVWDIKNEKLAQSFTHNNYVSNANFSTDGNFIVSASGNKAFVWDLKSQYLIHTLEGQTNKICFSACNPNGSKLITIGDNITMWDLKTSKSAWGLIDLGRCYNYWLPSAIFSTVGNYLATSLKKSVKWNNKAGDLLIMDYETGKPNLLIEGHLGAFSNNGRYFLSKDYHRWRVHLWDLQNGENIYSVSGHKDIIDRVVFNPEGFNFVTATKDIINIWETNSGNLLQQLPGMNSESFEISPNSKNILVKQWGGNNSLIIDIERGQIIHSLEGHKEAINFVKYSPDGKFIVTTSDDNTARIWNSQSGELIHILEGHEKFVSFAVYSPDGNKLVTSSADETVKMWDVSTGKLLFTFDGKIKFIWNLSFSPDGKNLITTISGNKELYLSDQTKIWDTSNGNLIHTFNDGSSYGNTWITPDNKYVVISTFRSISIRDVTSGKLIRNWTAKDESSLFYGTALSEDGKIIATSSSSFDLWDVASGIKISTLSDYYSTREIDKIIFSPNGRSLIIKRSFDTSMEVWDLIRGKLHIRVPRVFEAVYSPDGKYIFTSGPNGIGEKWDIEKGKRIFAVNDLDNPVFTPDGNYIVAESNGIVKIIDAKNGQIINNVGGHSREITSLNYTSDGKKLITTSLDETAKIWDIEKGKLNYSLKHDEAVYQSVISPDQKYVATASADKTAKVWNIESGELLHKLIAHKSGVYIVRYSPDGDKLITASFDGTVKVWNSQKGELLFSLDGHNLGVLSASFSSDGRHIITTGEDRKCIFWDSETGRMLVQLFLLRKKEYIYLTDDKYYFGSLGAIKDLYWIVDNEKIYTFEQFDLKYNRPDLVLSRLGYASPDLVEAYHQAYLKRLKRMGFTEEQLGGELHVPETTIENFEHMPVIEEENVEIRLNFHDSKYNLHRYNVWVNEVPLYGMMGKSLAHLNSGTYSANETIPLSNGKNRIQLSCMNEKGAESYKETVEITCQPKVSDPQKFYFIGIGVDEYSDPGHNLNYSVKDIRDLARRLKEKHAGNITIDTLFNSHVTRENILGLKEKLLKTGVNDKVIISFSGHGLLSSSYDYYLTTYSTNFSNPKEGGLPYEDMEWLLDSIPARNKLLLIDACNSGEVDKEELLAMSTTENPEGVKGVKMVYEYEPTLGMKNSFELMQELFTNVNRGTGATIISAAAGTQFAYERGDLANGVFTYSILEIMNQKDRIRVSELKSLVGKRVEELTNGLQKPTSRTENIENDWWVW